MTKIADLTDKLRKLANEMEERGYQIKFSESAYSFVANAQLAKEIDDNLRGLKLGEVVLVENCQMHGNSGMRREVYLGEFAGYEKGTITDNWLGRGDPAITVALDSVKSLTIYAGQGQAGFGRTHVLQNANVQEALGLKRILQEHPEVRLGLNIRDAFVFTGPTMIKARLLLTDSELLESYQRDSEESSTKQSEYAPAEAAPQYLG